MEMSLFDNKLVLIGPYVGSLETEITTFRPFYYWLKENFNFPNIIVSTHYNRSFLYDSPVIPIFKQYSNDEKGQIYHKHDRINAKDYQYLINDIKDQTVNITNWNKKDIVIYNLGYSSTANHNILMKKKFNTISHRIPSNDNILFIPHSSRPKKELKQIYNKINNLKIICNRYSDFNEYNYLNEDGLHYYERMIEEIMKCRCVITPCSFWTFICNLHNIPVFSWGDNISIYKNTYRFDNEHFKGIPFRKGNNINIVIQSINKFLEEY